MLVCTIQIRVKSYKSIFVFSSIPVSMALLVSYSEVGGREGRKKKKGFFESFSTESSGDNMCWV